MALTAPDDVHARLGDINRIYIFEAFTTILAPVLFEAKSSRAATEKRPRKRAKR